MIGADASAEPVTAGYGSSRVVAPFVSTPLDAIRHRIGAGAVVSYADGGSTTRNLPPVPTQLVSPVSGGGQGLTLTLDRRDPRTGATEVGESVQTVVPTADVAIHPHPTSAQRLPGALALSPVGRSPRSLSFARGVQSFGASATPIRSAIVLPPGWSDVVATLTGTLTPHRTGLYIVSLQGSGAASLTLDGSPAVSDPLVHGIGRWSQTVSLEAGRAYRVDLTWDPIDTTTPSGETNVVSSTLTLGWEFVSDQIAAAAQVAARAGTAVVFAGRLQLRNLRPALLVAPRRPERADRRGGRRQPPHGGGAQHRWAGAHAVAAPCGRASWRRGTRVSRTGPPSPPSSSGTPTLRADCRSPSRQSQAGIGHQQCGPVAGSRPDRDLFRRARGGLPLQPGHRGQASVPVRLRALLHPLLPGRAADPLIVPGHDPHRLGDQRPGTGRVPPCPRPTSPTLRRPASRRISWWRSPPSPSTRGRPGRSR